MDGREDMRTLIFTLGLASLGACTIAQSDATASRPTGACHGEGLGQFTGQPASADLGARILRESGARTIRWVPKGSAVTMEYSAERVTVMLDGSNRVERASCG
jgi:Peptidase inhibitor I78 family